MAFMLPALGGLLGSMLFKQDGGKVGVPAMKSGRLSQMTTGMGMGFNPQFPYVKNPYIKKSGGRIKKGKGKHKKK
jgi:hypothetical protein